MDDESGYDVNMAMMTMMLLLALAFLMTLAYMLSVSGCCAVKLRFSAAIFMLLLVVGFVVVVDFVVFFVPLSSGTIYARLLQSDDGETVTCSRGNLSLGDWRIWR